MPNIVLASSSIYRRNLLKKLRLPFEAESPEIDEQALPGESPEGMVGRLSLCKAKALAKKHPDALIIGSDQIAVLGNHILTKPHTHERAKDQLRLASGRQVRFLTGLCLFNSASESHQLEIVPFDVTFLPLSEEQIENYLIKEKPYDCAGSFKSEGLGISLFERLEGEDPNTLEGLPLIRLVAMLRTEGVDPLV